MKNDKATSAQKLGSESESGTPTRPALSGVDDVVMLAGGVAMPRLGLGVWKCDENEARDAVISALRGGYRMIDTAYVYDNEREVGAGIAQSGVPRSSVFVTTKLWTTDHGRDQALSAFDESLANLGLEQVDQYLSHFPVTGKRVETWKALLELQKSGRTRSVGVSNYTIRHLQEIMDATGVAPAVNQVEFHPYLFQAELLEFCRAHKIQLVAYSPLTHGLKLKAPELVEVARSVKRTPAQVLIRWALQHGVVVIPKSSREARIRENAAVYDFELGDVAMATLNGFDEELRTCWDPSETP